MRKTSYNHQYFQDRLVGQQCLAFILWKFLKQQGAEKILDVGCGSGWLMAYLCQKGISQITGCDNAKEALRLAKKTAPSASVVKASATKLPFKNQSFDAVLAISLVEHLTRTETKKFLGQAHRVLKKGGWLFLVTPNFATPLRLIMGKSWTGYWDPTHISFYTPGSLKKILKDFSFENFRLTYPYSSKIPFDWGFPKPFYRLPKIIKNIIILLIVSTPLHYLRNSFWLAAQKKCEKK